ncbi:MAG TPA: methyltetrahydrofolate--corrinoid methyltransferase [Chloroflexi bacterium]|nr:methyltetrahydrofolate--corrinoid methyltransferase [Chloroflexota bacterium]
MYKIGENIHIVSPKVKEALKERDGAFFVDLARKQKEAGADAIDLNIGPRKKDGPEVVEFLLDCMQEAVPGMTISFDTTNLTAIETGLQRWGSNAIVNSTSAEPERLENVPPVAANYGAKLIALCMEKSGIPVSADARIAIAMEKLIPRAIEVGIPMENLLIDPLILTVSGCQEYVPEAVETVRMIKMVMDPPPMTVVGLSNVSNQVPHEMRPLINRVYMVMLMGAGLDAAILDPLDKELMDTIAAVEKRDESTPTKALYLKLHDAVAAMEELQPDEVDMSDPEQAAIWKTVQILLNKVIYTDSYLQF